MDLRETKSIQLIYKVIRNECENQFGTQDFQFHELLRCLTFSERYLAVNYFCQLPWNIGSLRVLHSLHQARLLSATEYLLSVPDANNAQLILNDFFETKYELLASLFISASNDSSHGIRLNLILENGLCDLFCDLLQNPKITNLNYMQHLSKTLPTNVLIQVIHNHINILVDTHKAEVMEAFSQFTSWINEGVDELCFIKTISETLFSRHKEEAFKHLINRSTSINFQGWKFYLILVQSIASYENDTRVFLKKYLKHRLINVANSPCKISMVHLLLTARAATASTMDVKCNLDAYASWYKQTIGEMSYVIDSEKFRVVVNLLHEVIPYEIEQQYLEIHETIAIAAPALCSKLVHDYKSKCKARLSQIKSDVKRRTAETS